MRCIKDDELILCEEAGWVKNIQPAHGDLGSLMTAWQRPCPWRARLLPDFQRNKKTLSFLLFFSKEEDAR